MSKKDIFVAVVAGVRKNTPPTYLPSQHDTPPIHIRTTGRDCLDYLWLHGHRINTKPILRICGRQSDWTVESRAAEGFEQAERCNEIRPIGYDIGLCKWSH